MIAAGRCVVSTTDATISAIDSLMRSCNWINVYMNLDDTLKNETLMFDVLTRLLVGLVHFSRFTHNAVQHLRVAKENCWAKILHRISDVTVMTSSS